MMERKSSLSFGESNSSNKGIFSIVLGVISIVSGLVLVIISSKSRGNAPMMIGACGLTAVICSIMGIVFSLSGAKEDKSEKTSAYIGFILNLVVTIAWACLFAIGL